MGSLLRFFPAVRAARWRRGFASTPRPRRLFSFLLERKTRRIMSIDKAEAPLIVAIREAEGALGLKPSGRKSAGRK
jgi:hypothetical protein